MKFVNIMLLILWCSLIFLLSNENAKDSSNTSFKFVNEVVSIIEKTSNIDIDDELINENIMGYVRGCAHFGLYFILGLFCMNVIKDYKSKCLFLYSILFCFFYACSDEFHQLYISGRTAQLSDLFIDITGSFMGIVCYLACYSYITKKVVFKKVKLKEV